MNNIKELLPIGTVIILKNANKKLMIFGIKQVNADNGKEYDYIGVLYPEGNIGTDNQYLFNHEDIQEVFFRGFEDEERAGFVENLQKFYDEHGQNM